MGVVRDSRIDVTNPYGAIGVNFYAGVTGTVIDSQVTLQMSGASRGAYGVHALDGGLTIQGSRIVSNVSVVSPPGYEAAVRKPDVGALEIDGSVVLGTNVGVLGGSYGSVDISIRNSTISGATYAIQKVGTTSRFRAGGSSLSGAHDGVSGTDKIVNCFDGNYDPIPSP